MSDAPFYRFYRLPRFSANQLAEYLCTTDPVQREAVIRSAKFPRRSQVAAYQQAIPSIRQFMTGNSGDSQFFDRAIKQFREKAEKEDGWAKDEALRCIAAIEAFKATFSKAKLNKVTFLAGPSDVGMKVEDVSINARLDPPLIERLPDGGMASGGCVLMLAASADARKNIGQRTKMVASLVYWTLQSTRGNVEPAARLCISFDAFGGQAVKASESSIRFRGRVAAACREATGQWAGIKPPPGYDGPDWR